MKLIKYKGHKDNVQQSIFSHMYHSKTASHTKQDKCDKHKLKEFSQILLIPISPLFENFLCYALYPYVMSF